jgi:capsular exopolysaccharide synthesis family protein
MNNESLIKTQQWIEMPVQHEPVIARSEYSADPQRGSILDYCRTLRRQKLALCIFGILGLVAGVGISFSQKPMYRATTAVEIQDNKDDLLATKMLDTSNSTTPAEAPTDVQTQVRILQSKSLIERALNKLRSASDEEAKAKSRSASLTPLRAGSPGTVTREGESLEQISKRLKVNQSGETRIVEIAFDAGDPVEAARFANALTSEFIQANMESHLEMNRRTTDWLLSQLDDLRGKLKTSETALQNYARQQGLIYTNGSESISEEKLRQLQTELSKAQAERVDRQSRSEVAHSVTDDTVPDVLNDNNLRAMESSLTDLRRQEADLGVVFKPDYTKAKRIRAEIEALESAIAAKRTEIVSRVDHELLESQRREQLLAGAYTRQMRFVADDSDKSIQYDMLKHDVDTNRQIYQAMLQRVKESSIASALKATNVRVLDPANPPDRPYKPNLPANSGAGMLCGLMIGVAGILVRAKANASVQEPGEAGLLLGIPELGVIPAAQTGRKRVAPARGLLLSSMQSETPETASTYPENSSVIADSFRSVLASILFTSARRRQQVLVVTSANPGEGKTTAATNLGATLANMKRKVLLIDGDIRSPRLHSIFGLDNSLGLTNVLQQIAHHDVPKIHSPIRQTAIPNLHVLTSGPAVESGADLLFSTSMPALIARYREEYEMILIDTPPMLLMPDARFLSRVADGVVLIARAGKTGRDAIQAACRRLLEDRTPIVGVVLNDWNSKLSKYSYYSNYKDSAAGQPGTVVDVLGA